jgi:uncharacterized protein YcbX
LEIIAMKVEQIGQVFVKATKFLNPESVEVERDGICHDRAFALVEADDKFINSDQHRKFIPLKFTYDAEQDSLRLELPDGSIVAGPASYSDRTFAIDHFGLRTINAAEVDGPWHQALSDYAERSIRLVRCLSTGGAIDVLPVTILTTGSLLRLAREVGAPVDASRFRAGFIIDNKIEHEEDGWDGRTLRIGGAMLKVRTAVPRCAITGFNPNSGERDQEVMKSLIRYRDKANLPDGMLPDYATPGFATYAEVIEPGKVSVGDTVELLA